MRRREAPQEGRSGWDLGGEGHSTGTGCLGDGTRQTLFFGGRNVAKKKAKKAAKKATKKAAKKKGAKKKATKKKK
jgi:hypothetical protein